MPEILWKAYIDFEVEEGERAIARALYERLIALSGHVKVWISYALFEAEAIPLPRAEREEDEDEEDEDEEKEAKMVPGEPAIARQVFERGYKDLKSKNLKSEVCFRHMSYSIYYQLMTPPFFHLACCPPGSVEDFRAEQRFGRGREEGGRNDADRHQETPC